MDTSGWYALLVERDTQHRAAVRHFQALARERRQLVVTDFVAGETYTLLRARRGPEAALGFLSRLRASPAVRRIVVERDWQAAAEQLLIKYREHVLSYTDATSFVAMKELGLRDVLTFDADFRLLGFHALGQ